MPAGRPITWTEEKKAKAFDEILELLSTTELGVEHICNSRDDFPACTTFMRWLREDEQLEQRYARARETQAAYITDTVGVLATQLVSKNPTHTIEPSAFKAYLDACKWRTEKLAPLTHGAKVDVTTKGKELKAGVIVVADASDKDLLESI